MHVVTRIAACLLIAALSAMISCGGQDAFNAAQDLSADWPGHGWEGGARDGAFVVVAVDSTERNVVPATEDLRLEATREGGETLVTVYGSELEGGSLYLHLKYDEQEVRPVEAQRGATLDENVLFLGITSRPGVVDMGLATIAAVPLPSGEVELAQVRFADGAFVANAARSASVISESAPDDLQFSGNQLQWTYNGAGDYDQNGETNIADLTPIGVHFDHSTNDGDHDPADLVVDGDGNGQINISDLTPIGANFLERMTDYQVQVGSSASGPFTDVGPRIAVTTGSLPNGGGFLEFGYEAAGAQLGEFYVVQVFDLTTAGPRSNVVQYSGDLAPPQNLTAGDDGSKVTLSWDPPASGTPEGYDAFVSDSADMSGALKMNAAPISGTTFDCNPIAVPVGAPHYFAVKAVYSEGSSGYSNIFGYMTGSGGAPTGLTAVKEGSQVRLNWTAPGPVDSYNAYVSDSSDMSGALPMNLPGQITTPTYLAPGSISADEEHYFAVKAVTDGEETGYSNVAHYIPGGSGDITPPQWQGGIGIRLVEPDDQKVKVYWYPAVDPAPGTNPVQYYIYWEEDGTPIDWNNPKDVVLPPQPQNTYFTITGLTNGQRYVFGVRAADSVAPSPNVTTNSNTIKSTPNPYPPEGAIGTIIASDIASVRMPGEEAPRVIAVTHGDELWFATYDGNSWQTTDLNAVINNPDRKYHPQAVAVGNEIHVLFATASEVFEFYGEKDTDPTTWTVKSVTGGLQGVHGTGFVHNATAGYLAAVYAADMGPSEQLFYVDRELTGEWNSAELVMTGDPNIWQCDLAIAEATGAQWIAAPNGPTTGGQGVSPIVWIATRPGRTGTWAAGPMEIDRGNGPEEIGGSAEIAIEIDPLINQPLVCSPEVEWTFVADAGQDVPYTNASLYSWNGSSWVDEPSSPIDTGQAINDPGLFNFSYEETGRDPQLVFSPTGKAVAIWTNVNVYIEYGLEEVMYSLTGGWHLSDRAEVAWSKPSTMIRSGIYSSNSVTAGEGYQHCLTCFVAEEEPGLSEDEVYKYTTRNDYPEGELYYFRNAWPSEE